MFYFTRECLFNWIIETSNGNATLLTHSSLVLIAQLLILGQNQKKRKTNLARIIEARVEFLRTMHLVPNPEIIQRLL